MTSVKAHLEENSPERVEKFVSNVQGAVKRILSDLKNFQVDTELNFTPFLVSKYKPLVVKSGCQPTCSLFVKQARLLTWCGVKITLRDSALLRRSVSAMR